MRTMIFMMLAAVMVLLSSSCSGPLSDEAKEMVGDYYITVISPEEPLMELMDDGNCYIHSIDADAFSYRVKGTWNVVDSTLIIDLDPSTVECEGDRNRIGHIAEEIRRPIVSFDGIVLTVNDSQGETFSYQRRQHKEQEK